MSGKTINTKKYTTAEVKKHSKSNHLWIIIDNNVYDITKFIDKVRYLSSGVEC